jgi:hypothetical protein
MCVKDILKLYEPDPSKIKINIKRWARIDGTPTEVETIGQNTIYNYMNGTYDIEFERLLDYTDDKEDEFTNLLNKIVRHLSYYICIYIKLVAFYEKLNNYMEEIVTNKQNFKKYKTFIQQIQKISTIIFPNEIQPFVSKLELGTIKEGIEFLKNKINTILNIDIININSIKNFNLELKKSETNAGTNIIFLVSPESSTLDITSRTLIVLITTVLTAIYGTDITKYKISSQLKDFESSKDIPDIYKNTYIYIISQLVFDYARLMILNKHKEGLIQLFEKKNIKPLPIIYKELDIINKLDENIENTQKSIIGFHNFYVEALDDLFDTDPKLT